MDAHWGPIILRSAVVAPLVTHNITPYIPLVTPYPPSRQSIYLLQRESVDPVLISALLSDHQSLSRMARGNRLRGYPGPLSSTVLRTVHSILPVRKNHHINIPTGQLPVATHDKPVGSGRAEITGLIGSDKSMIDN